MDFGRHMEVASLEATEEIMAVASFPQAPYVSMTIGTHAHPRSEHLGSLAWWFLDSVAWAAAVADTPASNKITGFSGEVMDTSNAAVHQLGRSMSAGRVLLWSLLKLLPTSTLTPM